MITSLQALRFVFALFVLFEHFPMSPDHPYLLESGAMGVSFFLILSGFVMSIGYESKVKSTSFVWKDFMLKRLIRLWPLHLLCLAAWIVLAYLAWGSDAIHPLPLIGNAFLLQWLPVEHIDGNSVAWCLSVLVVLYSVYPFLARLKSLHLVVLFLVIGVGLLGYERVFPVSNSHWYWYRLPVSRVLDFMIGILCYRTYRYAVIKYDNKWSRLPIFYRWLIEIVPIGLCACGLTASIINQTQYGSVVYFYLPIYLLILVFALSSTFPHRLSLASLVSQPWLIYLGEISFSFYMIHNLVILSIKQVLMRIAPNLGWEPRLAITIVTAIGLSILVNKFYEGPMANFLSKRLLPKKR